MRNYRFGMVLPLIFLTVAAAAQAALTPQEILRRSDDNSTFRTASYAARMEIDQGKRVLVKEMRAVAEGADKAFIEFTNPEDRGVRYLKIGKQLWMYFPEEQETVAISGHLLKEGMMGSDVSYEDALESASLEERYEVTLLGTETVDGRTCYVLELKAKLRTAPYDRQKLWIDTERFVTLRGEMYAKSGKLLKTSRALAVQRIGDRWYVTSLRMDDALKQGSGTTFTMTDLRFDIALSADQFSERRLSR